MTAFPDSAAWISACADDASLAAWTGDWSVCFAIAAGEQRFVFRFEGGRIASGTGTPAFTVRAPASVWDKFLQPVPPRHHHGLFAMHYRVPDFGIDGETLAFMQYVHVVRRVLEIGKWLALGHALPVPVTLAPQGERRATPSVRAGYVPVTAQGQTYQVYYEAAGTGRDVLCMHTAGSDCRQFHGLMADPRIVEGHRLVAFDLPWHGKSMPPEGAIPGSWRLNTELYVALIMGFAAAAGLDKPIALGASMSGEICLELAYRHPEAFTGIIACEACEKIERRQTSWAAHPVVNQSLFVPEWIRALSAPQSPSAYQEAIAWHYAQGGPAVFFGDIAFYSGDWDMRDRVGRIDTNRVPLFMLTGEYDYSCTVEMSEATAAKIPGVRFRPMAGIGHFPFAENPRLFAEYLLPVLGALG
ncbi:MAG TPA: alpha/beta hydrolase [Rhodopila sp.]|uniref:alpha/beta fold hydrolase n=1 Tax=Rhodopila sp. TaxID=2480087 RepID=UPI002C2E0396|nr:alpha/beta hydrolase [Rhodopila sp.]HVY15870.1 alpha/beta hydrolase [Rhodopila sp.]